MVLWYIYWPSLSARRAWIEIATSLLVYLALVVALRKESVDRNAAWTGVLRDMHVALRKESVDRNNDKSKKKQPGSLSARRAWIEMPLGGPRAHSRAVALRKESVDRNFSCSGYFRFSRLSLSARRAWIEIEPSSTRKLTNMVALRKESVDRNEICVLKKETGPSRSPQGERG